MARNAWDGSRVIKADRARKEKNALFDMLLSRVRAALLSLDMDRTLASMDVRSLSARLHRVMEGKGEVKAFTDYMEEFMGTKVKASTRESYAETLAKFRTHSSSCTFQEMDRAWLVAFDTDLFSCRSLAEDGRLEYCRSKTGKPYSVKVEPEAMGTIGRYKGKSFLLEVGDWYGDYKDFLRQMNDCLRTLGPVELAGTRSGKRKLRRPLFPGLTSYWARYT